MYFIKNIINNPTNIAINELKKAIPPISPRFIPDISYVGIGSKALAIWFENFAKLLGVNALGFMP